MNKYIKIIAMTLVLSVGIIGTNTKSIFADGFKNKDSSDSVKSTFGESGLKIVEDLKNSDDFKGQWFEKFDVDLPADVVKINNVNVNEGALKEYVLSNVGKSSIPSYTVVTPSSKTTSMDIKVKLTSKDRGDEVGGGNVASGNVNTYNTIHITKETVTPGVYANFKLIGSQKDLERDPKDYQYTVWREIKGPAPVIPKGKTATTQWNGTKSEACSFTKEGEYELTATDYYKWKIYTSYSYSINVSQQTTGINYYKDTITGYVFQENKEGEVPPARRYKIKITPQDIGVPVPVRDMDTSKQLDADVILIQ